VGSSDDEEEPATHQELLELRQKAHDPNDPDRACLSALPSAPDNTTLRSAMARIFVHKGKPPHVHASTWGLLTQQTRTMHANLLRSAQHAPPEVANMPLARACVELILRKANERGWVWSTIATNLAAFATALTKMTLYTNSTAGINIRANTYFSDTLLFAQRKARIGALHPKKAAPLSEDNFRTVAKKIEKHPAWYLLQLSWYLAGRVGDVRRLQPRHILLVPSTDAALWHLTAIFVEGKGAVLYGPFTIHTKMPVAEAKALLEYLRRRPPTAHAFDDAMQSTLKEIIKTLEDHSLRSIRKGSFVHLATKHNVSDSALQLLSGHKRMETLHRYLGWGLHSADAKRGAEEVGEARRTTTIHGGAAPQQQQHTVRPTWMGPQSGFQGKQGKRTRGRPTMFARKLPSARDLGLEIQEQSWHDWPLHTKEIDTVNCGWPTASRIAMAYACANPSSSTAGRVTPSF
jgi:hypothetical protein